MRGRESGKGRERRGKGYWGGGRGEGRLVWGERGEWRGIGGRERGREYGKGGKQESEGVLGGGEMRGRESGRRERMRGRES